MGICKICEVSVDGKRQYCVFCYRQKINLEHQDARARNLGVEGTIDLKSWVDLCKRHDYRCLRCGNKGISIDHIIALHGGGANDIDNVQPLCLQCNLEKTVDVDYRHEPLEKREMRWQYLQDLRLNKRRGEQGMRLTFSICLSGDHLDSIRLHLLQQKIQPTHEEVQTVARQWIYQDLATRVKNL